MFMAHNSVLACWCALAKTLTAFLLEVVALVVEDRELDLGGETGELSVDSFFSDEHEAVGFEVMVLRELLPAIEFLGDGIVLAEQSTQQAFGVGSERMRPGMRPRPAVSVPPSLVKLWSKRTTVLGMVVASRRVAFLLAIA